MLDNKNLIIKNSMTYGAIIGFGLILISFLQFTLNIRESFLFEMINHILMILVIFIGSKKIKDIEAGKLSYQRALWSGFLISFFASFLFSFYTYINLSFIDINGIEVLLSNLEEQFIISGIPDEQVVALMDIYNQILTPLMMAMGTLIGFTFWGFLFSLIISIFVKKKDNNPFNNPIEN